MTYQQSDLFQVENIGLLDRANRIIVGTTLIAVAVLFTAIPTGAVAGVVAAGFYAGLTGFIGWDPLYALANSVRRATPVRTPAVVTNLPYQAEQGSTGGYKQAA